MKASRKSPEKHPKNKPSAPGCFLFLLATFPPRARADPGRRRGAGLAGDMPEIEELSPAAGPVSIRPPEDEIDDDEDEDVSA